MVVVEGVVGDGGFWGLVLGLGCCGGSAEIDVATGRESDGVERGVCVLASRVWSASQSSEQERGGCDLGVIDLGSHVG